ncbi:MAG: hypothetical protein P8M05_01325 [Flavobacteriales bacterium]|nr:hypothetical protein [Flavobacteriales bacterium]
MELRERMISALDYHGIDSKRELIISSNNGDWCYIPLFRLIDIVSSLYKTQQKIIEQRLIEVASNANRLMEFLYYLAKPIAAVRI